MPKLITFLVLASGESLITTSTCIIMLEVRCYPEVKDDFSFVVGK